MYTHFDDCGMDRFAILKIRYKTTGFKERREYEYGSTKWQTGVFCV